MIKKGLIMILLAVLFMAQPAEAKTNYKYVTRAISLKELPKKKSATIEKLHQNDKVILLKKGKRWSRVQHGGQVGYIKTNTLNDKRSPLKYTPKYFKRRGVIRWGGCKWTWYTQRRLPGRGLKIPGRHLDKKYGYVLDKDGYIVLASSVRNKKKRLIVPTPFGRYGKVYDTNGKGPNNWRDVYTNW